MTEKIILHDPTEATIFLVHIEGQIRAARHLWKEVQQNQLGLDADTSYALMEELESAGQLMSKMKFHILQNMDLRSYPIMEDRI